MSSLTYSLAFYRTYTPRNQYFKYCSSCILPKKLDKNGSHLANGTIQQPKSSDPRTPSSTSELSHTLRRREVLATGVSLGLLANVLVETNVAQADDGACEFTASPSGLGYCDQLVGTGPQAAQGQLIKAHYVGKLESGKIFDSSYNRGKPLTFRVGVGEVIKGWDQGILGNDGVPPMFVGGKRKLKIPPQLGYGARGAGCKGGTCIIPPDSVLLFDIEFVGY